MSPAARRRSLPISTPSSTTHTYTVIRQNLASPFRDLQPYVVAMIGLDEGVRMTSTVTGVPVDDIRVGMPVECYVVKVEDGLGLLFWRPATA